MSNTASDRAAQSSPAHEVSGTRPALRARVERQALVRPTLSNMFEIWSSNHGEDSSDQLEERLSVIADTLRALDQLHNNTEIPKRERRHGNLNPTTIVIGLTGISSLVLQPSAEGNDADRPLGYQAPELLLRKRPPSPVSDIFSAGVLLYECLTKKQLYPEKTAEAIVNSAKRQKSLRSQGLSEQRQRVLGVVERATNFHPAGRYSSARLMLQALLDALGYTPERRVELAAHSARHMGFTSAATDDASTPSATGSEQTQLAASRLPPAPSAPSLEIRTSGLPADAATPASLPRGAPADASTTEDPGSIDPVESEDETISTARERPSNLPTLVPPSRRENSTLPPMASREMSAVHTQPITVPVECPVSSRVARFASDSPAPAPIRSKPLDVQSALDRALKLRGCLGAALVDCPSGLCLGTSGSPEFDLELAAAGHAAAAQAEMNLRDQLGLEDTIDEMLFTITHQYHLVRVVGSSLLFYVVLERNRANLALARRELAHIDSNLALLRI